MVGWHKYRVVIKKGQSLIQCLIHIFLTEAVEAEILTEAAASVASYVATGMNKRIIW